MFILYFVFCELIVRYENMGSIAFSYEKTRTNVSVWNSEYMSDYVNWDECGRIDPLIPNKKGYLNGVKIEINSLGMRGKEYSLQKPQNTFRIVIIGASTEFGPGIENKDLYQTKLENMLNASGDERKYEVLNINQSNSWLPCLLINGENARAYSPDMIVLSTIFNKHGKEHILSAIDFYKRTGIPILAMSYNDPVPEDFKKIAQNEIFLTNLDVQWGKEDYVNPSDGHPNARIHQLFAKSLFDYFQKNKQEIFIKSRPQAGNVQPQKFSNSPNSHLINGFSRYYYWGKIKNRLKTMLS